jgi:arylformamidase
LMPTWRELSASEREREYSPSSAIGGDYQPFLHAYAEQSALARARTPGRLNVRYGATAPLCLDLFVPEGLAAPAALLVFIHGGYWQELSKDESSFAANDCVAQGLAYAAIDYTLAPAASIAQMVAECEEALSWLVRQASELGVDAARIVLAGSSAGAHLAALVALLTKHPLAGLVLVSGIYELEPLVGTSINQALGLSVGAARGLSPALQPLARLPRSMVCWGEVETAEFKRQSRDFATRLQDHGVPVQAFELPARNHFDAVLDLADMATPLGQRVVDLMHSL